MDDVITDRDPGDEQPEPLRPPRVSRPAPLPPHVLVDAQQVPSPPSGRLISIKPVRFGWPSWTDRGTGMGK